MKNKEMFPGCFLLVSLLVFPNTSAAPPKICCSSLLLDTHLEEHKIRGERLGFYSQLGYYGGRPAYRQQGGKYFIYYYEDDRSWIDSKYFIGDDLLAKLVNDMDGYCLDDHDNWSFYNGSIMVYSEMLESNCFTIDEVCCEEINIASENSEKKTFNKSFYGKNPKESLGVYKAIGMVNGRYIYQKENHDRFLEYGYKHWLVSTGVGKSRGHIHHTGGSVCPEHIEKEWEISDKDKNGAWFWKDDPELKITCVKKKNDKKDKDVSEDMGTKAKPLIQRDIIENESSYSSGAIGFGCLSMLLLSLMIGFFARRFKRAWDRGAHGKSLLFQTMDIECQV